MDLRRAITVCRQWWLLLVGGALIAALVTLAVTKSRPTTYAASATLQVHLGVAGDVSGGQFNETQAAWAQAQLDAQLVRAPLVATTAVQSVHSLLQTPLTPDALLASTSASAAYQSTLVNVTVSGRNAHDVAILATAMASAFVKLQAQTTATEASASLAVMNAKITQLSLDENAAQSAPPATRYARTAIDQLSIASLTQESTTLSLQRDALSGGVTLLQNSSASAPDSKATTLAVLAGLITLILFTGFIFLLDHLKPRPYSASQVAEEANLPLLGTIGPASPGAATLPMLYNPSAPLADDYRLLRANLAAKIGGGQGRAVTLAIAGAAATTGATTVAINIAVAAARAGIRVVLIDAQVRRPAIHTLLALQNTTGFTTLLREGVLPASLMQESSIANLRILTAGPTHADSVDLIGSGAVHRALRQLDDSADLIIIDTGAAIGPESCEIAAQCDSTLLIENLAACETPVLRESVDRMTLAGARLTGIVVVRALRLVPGRHRKRIASTVSVSHASVTTGVTETGLPAL